MLKYFVALTTWLVIGVTSQVSHASSPCTPQEVRLVQELQLRTVQALNAGRLDLLFGPIMQEGLRLRQVLSVQCQIALDAPSGYGNSGRNPDTGLVCRGGVCCGPTGCS